MTLGLYQLRFTDGIHNNGHVLAALPLQSIDVELSATQIREQQDEEQQRKKKRSDTGEQCKFVELSARPRQDAAAAD